MKKYLSLLLLSVVLIMSPINVLASETQGVNTVGNSSCTVTADVLDPNQYIVTIPKMLEINHLTGKANYTVDVTGTLDEYTLVSVVPDSTFDMVRGTKRVTATVEQDKTIWDNSEVDGTHDANGVVTANNLTMGDWSGSFNFNVDNKSTYIDVTSKDEQGNDLDASATLITGDRRNELLESLEETGMINSKEDVDALINVESDDFEGMADTTFDVSNIAQEGDKVVILHYDETKQEWEYIGTETVDEEGKISGDFSSYSPVAFVKVKDDGSLEHVHNYTERITKEPTCLVAGTKEFRCGCGDAYTEDIECTTHKLNGKTCIKCGTEFTEPGFYSQDGTLLCGWDASGIDIIRDYGALSSARESTSGYNTVKRYTGTKVVIFPEGLTGIGEYGFYDASGITNVYLPDSLTTIGGSVFSGCDNLVDINLPKNLETIDYRAFEECSLTDIIIPKSVTSISSGVFMDCKYLDNISVEEGNTVYYSGSFNAIIETSTNILNTGGGKTIIPDNIVEIADHAFCGRINVTDITIPASVKTIGWMSFYNCNNLDNLILSNGLKTIEGKAFYNTSIKEITLPNTITTMGSNGGQDTAFGDSRLKKVIIEDGTNSICSYAFRGCYILQTVIIPDGVTSIGSNAFSGCSSLNSINIPDGVTSIGTYAFSGCYELELTVPDGVATIGNNAFYNVNKVYYNGGATGSPWGAKYINPYIDENGFVYCNGDRTTISGYEGTNTDIVIPEGITTIAESAFSEKNITSVEFPSTLLTIGDYAFSYCDNLVNITIPDSVENIGNEAFYGVFNVNYNGTAEGSTWGAKFLNKYIEGDFAFLDSSKEMLVGYSGSDEVITIPDGVKTIGDGVFQYNYDVTKVEFPDSVETIGAYTFYCCSNLTDVVLSENLTTIGSYAFSSCSKLVNIELPSSVREIGEDAFYSCSSLTKISIPDGVTVINSMFGYCSKLNTVTIPKSVTLIKTGAFSSCRGLTTMYYTGTAEEWEAIEKETKWNYNCSPTMVYNHVVE